MTWKLKIYDTDGNKTAVFTRPGQQLELETFGDGQHVEFAEYLFGRYEVLRQEEFHDADKWETNGPLTEENHFADAAGFMSSKEHLEAMVERRLRRTKDLSDYPGSYELVEE